MFADSEELDQRIAYDANCSWWDKIQKIKTNQVGIPCCPYCNGMLFKMANEETWFTVVDKYDKKTKLRGNYRKFIEWLRGKCFLHEPNRSFFWVAIQSFQEETGIILKLNKQQGMLINDGTQRRTKRR